MTVSGYRKRAAYYTIGSDPGVFVRLGRFSANDGEHRRERW